MGLAEQVNDIGRRGWAIAGLAADLYDSNPSVAERIKHDASGWKTMLVRANMPVSWQSDLVRQWASLDRPVSLMVNEAQRFLQSNFSGLQRVNGAVKGLGDLIDGLVQWKPYTGQAVGIVNGYDDKSIPRLVLDDAARKLPIVILILAVLVGAVVLSRR